jgi:2-polyprenyl-6-methoxyphenol hydroxylase-like FAD-dependent oxidoreductase
LREILARGVKINWGTSVTGWEEVDDGVIVSLSDGKTVKGSILAGADGKNSNIKRKILGEEKAKLYTFPMGFVGLKMRLAPEKIAPFRDLSRIFFHGTHPNGKFIFFSTISTPEVNGSKGTENEYFEAQLNMSWNAGDATQDILNLPPAEKLKELKKAATEGTGFFKELREGFNNIPDDTEVLDIVLQDWMTESWQPLASVTILGDAVHPMTMCRYIKFYNRRTRANFPDRGEAANHGMFDAYMLGCQLHKVSMGEKDMAKAIEDFEREMVSRAQEAVSLSRTAGFEVHDLDAISESSALFQYPHLQRLEALMSQ